MYCLILDNIYTLWPAFYILFLIWSLNCSLLSKTIVLRVSVLRTDWLGHYQIRFPARHCAILVMSAPSNDI